MRRVVGLVLAGLGTCLIVFAVLMPTFVASKVLKFPLNEYETATLTASNVSYFSPTKLTELTGVNMEATYTIKGNDAAGSSSTAVWNEFTYVYDETNKLPFQTTTRTFAFDRRTAQLVECCGANVNGDSSVRQTGYVGYVLPIGTKKQTYDIFDPTLNKPMPLTYAGTGTVDGIPTYRFVENVSPTKTGSQTLPGSLVGMSQASVTLPEYYQLHLTYWVDPTTGALLNVTEDQKLTLEDSTGAQALLLLDANFAATKASVDSVVALDNSGRSKVSLVTTILPLAAGILGVILLAAGILLSRKPREDIEAGPAAAPELAAADEEPATPVHPVTQASLVPGLEDPPAEAEAEAEAPAVEAEAAEAPAAEAEAETAEAPAAEAEAAEAPAAEAEVAESPAAEAEATESPAAEADAAEAPAPEASSEAPEAETEAEAAESPAAETQEAQAPEAAAPGAEAPEAETAAAPEAQAAEANAPAVESQEQAESSEAAPAAVEAPTAEIPAAVPEANGQPQEEASATTPRRGRRVARHRR
jgi:hypothetical protein